MCIDPVTKLPMGFFKTLEMQVTISYLSGVVFIWCIGRLIKFFAGMHILWCRYVFIKGWNQTGYLGVIARGKSQ